MGAPRPFEMTKRSVAAGSNEWERLEWENRAGQELFTQSSGISGMTRVVLMQLAQLLGINESVVPRFQEDELQVHHAGTSLTDQARAQNLRHFLDID